MMDVPSIGIMLSFCKDTVVYKLCDARRTLIMQAGRFLKPLRYQLQSQVLLECQTPFRCLSTADASKCIARRSLC